MARYYQGRYVCQHPEKYRGNFDNIQYRSSWERSAMRWCDLNPDVIGWNSEEEVIPYRCSTDGEIHRYFVDLKIWFSTGKVVLVEIKPKSQTIKPPPPKRKTRKALNECLTYMKNESKWLAAMDYCQKRGYVFQIWTEETLKGMGMKLI